MRFLIRSVTGLFLLSVTLGLLTLAGYSVKSAVEERMAREARPPVARERVFAANVVEVVPGRIVPELVAFGTVESRRTLELRAPSGGRVVELAPGFEDGAEVSAGQVLVRIDPSDAETALQLARTALDEARAEEAEAIRALDIAADDLAVARTQAELRDRALARQREIDGRGLSTAGDLEAAELAAASAAQAVLSKRQALATAEARRNSAAIALARQRISLAEAERRLADTVIRAGFDGALSEVSVVEGGLVSPNEMLAELVDPAALEVAFRVSTAQYARLLDPEGRLMPAEVTVTLDVYGAEIVAQGRLARVGAAVGEGQTGRTLYAALAAAPGFRPGDFVTVAIAEPALDGVALAPATAVGPDATVLALGEEDRLEEVAVEVLRRQGDDVILRAAALWGREIVAERSPLLGAGIRVRPLRPATTAGAATDEAEFVELSAERRAELIAFIEGNAFMPEDAKARVLAQLQQDRVPARVVARIEERMGG